jgi:CheY-like chemotaxis protein
MILPVESGAEALSRIESRGYCMAVIDDSVTDMTGEHLVYLLHTVRRSLPIVFVSGEPTVEQEKAVRQSGAVLYGPKSDWDLLRKALHHFASEGKIKRSAQGADPA